MTYLIFECLHLCPGGGLGYLAAKVALDSCPWFATYMPNLMKFPLLPNWTKWILGAILGPALLATNSHAVFVIAGVTDGDLSGGNPKAIFLQAAAPVADLSQWGVGSANNGGGTDGEEFTLPAGSANAGDFVIVTGNNTSRDFFVNNFTDNFTVFVNGAANINGDDAIELFNNGSVFDTYGDPNVDGSGESWEYADGFALRTGGGPGAFNQGNYQSVNRGFDGLDEAGHVALFVSVAEFTAVPEPGVTALCALGAFGLLRRRRK